MSEKLDRRWLRNQVRRFRDEQPKYEMLADTLQKVLGRVCARLAPMATFGARCKTIQSFAEKAIRKQQKYQQPWRQLTDLAGGRIVTYTQAEADAVCRWVEREDGLTVDWANSENTRRRLRTGEFGYLASHYIVQLTGSKVMGVAVGPGLHGLKCEIQVCTFLQHVYAAIGHDRIYKSNLRIPAQIERKSKGVAALLETADAAFAETAASLDQYLSAFETSLPPDRLAGEIGRWQAVLAADPAGPDRDETLCRIGQLQLAAQQGKRAYATMKPLARSQRPDLRRELGRAAHRAGHDGMARRHLEAAIELEAGDWLAHKYLGDIDLRARPADALAAYAEAHRLAPEEPRVLVPFLECELQIRKDDRVLRMMRGSLQAGIDECRRRIDLQVHVPQSHLEEGRLALYLEPGRPYAALAAYSRAVADLRSCAFIATELEALERIVAALQKGPDAGKLEECASLQGFVWVRDFLRVALVARSRRIVREFDRKKKGDDRGDGDTEGGEVPAWLVKRARRWSEGALLAGIGTADGTLAPRFSDPVLIVAGGCSPEAEQEVGSCRAMLRRALAGFSGTVIGGGTEAGISGLTARLVGRRPDVRLLGYLPADRPPSDRVHRAYTIIEARGCGYTPLGPLQTWADLLRAEIAPEDVRVLGVNGGDLAGFEYRLALALGAPVGVIQGSGRAAERLLPDPFWQDAEGFAPLPRDPASIEAFVNLGRRAEAPLTGRKLDQLARRVHENYRRDNLGNPKKMPANLLPWRKLPDHLKGSNRDQVRYAVFVLRRAGFEVVPHRGSARSKPRVPDTYRDWLEFMAEMEHGRYNAERLSTGWRLGDENDATRRTNPTLVAWDSLPNSIKQYDRDAVEAWPALLWRAGLKIVDPR